GGAGGAGGAGGTGGAGEDGGAGGVAGTGFRVVGTMITATNHDAPAGEEGPKGATGPGGGSGGGGFGGGHGALGSQGGAGGGGLGAGGDIFIAQGGTLTVDGGLLAQGTVTGGNGEQDGQAFGSGIFLQGNETATLSAVGGQTLTVSGVIADQTGSGGAGAGALAIGGPGVVALDAKNTFVGGIAIDGGTLDLAAAGAAGAGAIVFANLADPKLEFSAATAPTVPIGGFAAGDALQVDHFALTNHSYADNMLTLDGPGGPIALDLPGIDPSDLQFSTLATTAGTNALVVTTSQPACYLQGVRILTPGGERAVETLAIGDRVLTHRGRARRIRWIGRRSYAGAFARVDRGLAPVQIAAGALADGVPARDLFVSQEHALLLDGVLVPARHLVDGRAIRIATEVDPIVYFHIELASHDVILAEGAPAETFVDCESRGIFHNAAEYAALYPGASRRPARFCAPVVEDGPRLAAITARLAERAAILCGAAAPGPLEGYLDEVMHEAVRGWAYDPAHPEIPVALEVFDRGTRIATTCARSYRADVQAAGFGDGCCAFDVALDPPLDPFVAHEISVRRISDGAQLLHGPMRLAAAQRSSGTTRSVLARMLET
ncbi:MAG: Hint domain-containing protein, partial [Acetobacteraceae bacterium]